MRVITLKFLYFYLLLWTGVAGKNRINSCGNATTIRCDSDYHMVITDIKASSNMTNSLLQKCNARQECHVDKENNECIEMQYWCQMDSPYLEIKESSTVVLTSTATVLKLVSEHYYEGRDSDAENIHCRLQLKSTGNHETQIQLYVQELAPFSTTKDVCLNVDGSRIPDVCSGSGALSYSIGPYHTQNELLFSLTLANNFNLLPKVRFWLDLVVSANEEHQKRLECSARPISVASLTKTWPKDGDNLGYSDVEITSETVSTSMQTDKMVNAAQSAIGLNNIGSIIAIVVGSVALLAVLTCAIVFIFKYRRKRTLIRISESLADVDEHQYDYIDMNARVARGKVGDQNPPPVPRPRTHNWPVSRGPEQKEVEEVASHKDTDHISSRNEETGTSIPVEKDTKATVVSHAVEDDTNCNDAHRTSDEGKVKVIQEEMEDIRDSPDLDYLQLLEDKHQDQANRLIHTVLTDDEQNCCGDENYEGLCNNGVKENTYTGLADMEGNSDKDKVEVTQGEEMEYTRDIVTVLTDDEQNCCGDENYEGLCNKGVNENTYTGLADMEGAVNNYQSLSSDQATEMDDDIREKAEYTDLV